MGFRCMDFLGVPITREILDGLVMRQAASRLTQAAVHLVEKFFADRHHASFRWDCWAMAARAASANALRFSGVYFAMSCELHACITA